MIGRWFDVKQKGEVTYVGRELAALRLQIAFCLCVHYIRVPCCVSTTISVGTAAVLWWIFILALASFFHNFFTIARTFKYFFLQ